MPKYYIPTNRGRRVVLSYSTAFPLTENPMSEGGRWINGGTIGLDWKNVQTSPGLAFGPANFLANHYDDATAVLAGVGAWAPNHQIEATVKSINQQTGSNYQELELRLRTSISPHVISGYEFNWRCNHDGTQYHQIGYWYGPIGIEPTCVLGCAFDAVPGSTGAAGNGLDATLDCFDTGAATAAWGTSKYGGLFDGDTVGAQIIGNQITSWMIHNGIKVILEQFNDTGGVAGGAKFLSGSPGIGHWFNSAAGAVSDFGFTSMKASEIL